MMAPPTVGALERKRPTTRATTISGMHILTDHAVVYIWRKLEVDALGVITISRGCFERCGSFLFRLLYV